ncbi:MAG: glycosyltransferase family 2 protein [Rubrobacter sp.]|nr:glycosyltransferase family 2 protein [Rubrobacter sp.]
MLDLEVIVVDNALEDATFEVACWISARDSRDRVLRNERNSDPSIGRNHARETLTRKDRENSSYRTM